MFTGIWSDLLFAARSLSKARAYTFVCVVSLGIGMVPVVAVPFLSRILQAPPPVVSHPEELVEVYTTTTQSRPATNSWSYPDFEDLRKANTGMQLFGWTSAPSAITLPSGRKTAVYPLYVSTDYFKTLGVTLARGAGFESETDAAVVVGYQFWQNNLNSDPEIVGKTIKLDNVPYVVAGVAPELFVGHQGLDGKEMFVPLGRYPDLLANPSLRFDRGKEWLLIHGRIAPGVSVAQASAAVAGVTSQLAKEYPSTNQLRAGAVTAYDSLGVQGRSQFRRLQAVAMTLTWLVLLVVCLNLSGMMQVRSAMRERELSIRQAIGATRLRLARHVLAEAVLLAVAGGTIASLVLFNAPIVGSRFFALPIPPQVLAALKPDLSMIAISLGICLVTSVIFGFLPALRFSRPVILSALKDDAGAGGFRVGRVHRFTAALQIAIAVPLLVLGGISLDRVRSTAIADLGFDSDLLYAAPLELDAGAEAPTAAEIDFRIRSLRENLANAGGVASATVADGLPLGSQDHGTVVSLQAQANGSPTPVRVQVTRVGDRYLNTMGIPLLSGRDFSGDDSAGAQQVTIITKPLADRLFPNGEAIGKRLTFGVSSTDAPPQELTIVGVAADFPTSGMDSRREQLLLPLSQLNLRPKSITTDESGIRLPDLILIARSAPGQQPAKMTAALENVVREFDPGFQRDRIVVGNSLRKYSMDNFLKQSAIAGTAAGVILLLSALGIYGVMGLMVATRTREIAVRVALGASRRRVLAMILLDVVKLTAPGIGVGLLLAAAFIRLNGENIGIPLSNVENLAYVVGAAIAILVAILASLVPARRAASVLPMVAMRSE